MQHFEINFSFSITPLKSSKLFCVSMVYFFLLLSSIFHGMDVPQFTHPLKDIWVVSSLQLLLIKLL